MKTSLLTGKEMAEAIGRTVKFLNWQHDVIAQAQNAKALKTVGEWLQVKREYRYADDNEGSAIIYGDAIDALRQGYTPR